MWAIWRHRESLRQDEKKKVSLQTDVKALNDPFPSSPCLPFCPFPCSFTCPPCLSSCLSPCTSPSNITEGAFTGPSFVVLCFMYYLLYYLFIIMYYVFFIFLLCIFHCVLCITYL